MPRFRPLTSAAGPPDKLTSVDDVRRLIADAVRPGHFFVGRETRLEWDHAAAEDISWEVFRGRLLDPAHTRQRRTFEVWNVYLIVDGARSPEPLLSVKFDAAAGQIHVVRAILSYAHEGYDSGGNVILTREVRKWVRELVGTIDLADFANADDLLDEIVCRLFQAVVGTSRLPLTSIEAPLPAFTFGQLAYFYRSDARAEPIHTRRELVECGLHPELTKREKAKWLETMLRSEPPNRVHRALKLLDSRIGSEEAAQLVFPLLRTLFNEVSLSPFTDLTHNALQLAWRLGERLRRADEPTDFLARLLCQIARHLIAYDLVQFHHAGANYPDALLLDAVLRHYLTYIQLSESSPIYIPPLFLDPRADEAFIRRLRFRRRGLRQAWLIRERYRGYLVPDAPTSPGENLRVLPTPFTRVPEEQILNPHLRTRQLFADDPLGESLSENVRAVLRQSVIDLQHPHELRELGMALYLDRPLGMFKAPGEPDQTPLLSYEAFSRNIALRRLESLGRDRSLLPEDELTTRRESLLALPIFGVPLSEVAGVPRPGAVSLADAHKAAEDFVFLRTTASSARTFFALFDFAPLTNRFGLPDLMSGSWLILGAPEKESGEIVLTIHEAGTLRKRLELSANPRDGYIIRAGGEYPHQGLRVRRVWEEIQPGDLRERDLRGEPFFLLPV